MKVHMYRSNRSTWCGRNTARFAERNLTRNPDKATCKTCIKADRAEQHKQDVAGKPRPNTEFMTGTDSTISGDTMSSLAVELPNEINRVRKIQDHFKELQGMPNVIVEPQIAMMEASITRAIIASSGNDVIEMLRCYEDLKGYEE